MLKSLTHFTLILFLGLCPFLAQSQSWEVYNQNLELQSRVIYDKLEFLGETVKIGHVDSSMYLLSQDLKPAVELEAEEVYQYLSPWILVKSSTGLGAYHEYGQKSLDPVYDDIQTFYNFLLARKGRSYFVFERGSRKTIPLGDLDDAILTHTGMVITKKGNRFYLPFSKFPDKAYEKLEENPSNFLLAKEGTGLGLINREGDYIIQPVLDQLEHTKGNYFYGFDDSQYLLIQGKELRGEIRYNSFHRITREGDLMLEYIHGKLRRIMDEKGILLDTVGMEKVELLAENQFFVSLRDGKKGLYGTNGWLVQPTDSIDAIRPSNFQYFPAVSKGKMGLLNNSGKWIIEPEFSEINPIASDLSLFKNQGKLGLVGLNGEIISMAKWSKFNPFESGFAITERESQKFLVNKKGLEITSSGYDEIFRLTSNRFLVESEGKSGILNTKGEEIFAPEFELIKEVSNNFLVIGNEGKVGLADAEGNLLFPIDYEDIIVDATNDQILLKTIFVPVVIAEPQPEPTKKKRKKKGA